MQIGRNKLKQNPMLLMESKVQEVEEKRAQTCHTRKRKRYVSNQQKMAKMIKIKEEIPVLKEEVEIANRFKEHRKQKMEEAQEK